MRNQITILLTLLLGCSPANQPITGSDTSIPPVISAKPIDPSTTEAWSRLRPVYWTAQDSSRFVASWSWWANPAGTWLPDYAADVYGPLRDQGVGLPLSWRPFYDAQRAGPCWIYGTEDGTSRCLPGWAQLDVDDERDGFYAEPTCHVVDQWLAVLPSTQTTGKLAQRFLVLVRPSPGAMPSIYAADQFSGRVWQRRLTSQGARECVEFVGDQLKFFRKGDRRTLNDYVPLGSADIDIGPG